MPSSEATLSTRESDLSMYVAQLQENFDRRESEWWTKQLGAMPANPRPPDDVATRQNLRHGSGADRQ